VDSEVTGVSSHVQGHIMVKAMISLQHRKSHAQENSVSRDNNQRMTMDHNDQNEIVYENRNIEVLHVKQ